MTAVARIIPVLTVSQRQLVKTLKFSNPKYVGDPINAIKVFNDKEVDELILLDIFASSNKKEPDYGHLKEMAGESFMPLGYGGGIDSFDISKRVFNCGIEKVILNSAVFNNLNLVSEIAGHFGTQSVAISLDYKKVFLSGIQPVFLSGKKVLKTNIPEFAKRLEEAGAGEIILHSIDKEGTFSGYDLEMLQKVVKSTTIPVVPLGGAAGSADFKKAIFECGAHAAAAASVFFFKNNDRDSILINYSNNILN
jgi:cyclase